MTSLHSHPITFSNTKQLPRNVWQPNAGASIMVYWRRFDETSFEVALQLIDRALLADDEVGIIVWTTVGWDRPGVPFSLRDAYSGTLLLKGRFEWRQSGEEPGQLWLVAARYPGGNTPAAQIA
jgi:hypothetical protein